MTAMNGTAVAYPSDMTLHELALARADARGEAVAVRCGDKVLSYADLRRRVDQLANYLRERVGPAGRRVAVCVDRFMDFLIVALLATVAAGYAYVPLDPGHPPARLRRIVEDASVAAIVVDDACDRSSVPEGVTTVDLRAEAHEIAGCRRRAPVVVSPSDPAYVIYTSGLTGQPKGVEISHRSVVNLLCAMAERPGLSSGDVLVAVTTVSFDIAALELFLPLVTGRDRRHSDAGRRRRSGAVGTRHRACRSDGDSGDSGALPIAAAAGLRPGPGLKVLCGGEALGRELADRIVGRRRALERLRSDRDDDLVVVCPGRAGRRGDFGGNADREHAVLRLRQQRSQGPGRGLRGSFTSQVRA